MKGLRTYHGFTNSILCNRVFDIIDADGSKFIDWPEFLRAMILLNSKSADERIELTLEIYDIDGNGRLS